MTKKISIFTMFNFQCSVRVFIDLKLQTDMAIPLCWISVVKRVMESPCTFHKILARVISGSLYYSNIVLCKIAALKAAKGNFEYKMSISPAVKIEVAWWRENNCKTIEAGRNVYN